jgi:hypothetical protein
MVCSLGRSSRAIPRLLRPSAASATTCSSRAVSIPRAARVEDAQRRHCGNQIEHGLTHHDKDAVNSVLFVYN